ncbi:MAG: hypothetical protein SGI74_14415 [Oligoflexia bacterium]|nr:hypothetical protein [Oligoflexia bacterium]
MAQPRLKPETLLCASMLAGCSKKEDKKQNTVLEAYRLIDEQRTDEAIELLESAITKEPSNTEYKVVLASAYAHKGGIKVQKLVPIINHSEKLKKLGEKLPELNKAEAKSQRVNQAALNLSAVLVRFAGFLEAYASVPLATPNQATYIRHAIYILNELGNKVKPEDALYRAVLEIVLLKHILAENFVGEFLEPANKEETTCRIDLGNVNDAAITLGKLLIDILNDIGFSNPDQAEAMKRMANETSETVSNLTIFFTSATVVDEVSNIFVRQAAVQHGFGKIIKCNGF